MLPLLLHLVAIHTFYPHLLFTPSIHTSTSTPGKLLPDPELLMPISGKCWRGAFEVRTEGVLRRCEEKEKAECQSDAGLAPSTGGQVEQRAVQP